MPGLLAQDLPPITRGDTNVELVAGILMFVVAGALLALAPLVLGALVRSTRINPEKAEPYECGEPVIGQSWVQFDLRFYIVALFFIAMLLMMDDGALSGSNLTIVVVLHGVGVGVLLLSGWLGGEMVYRHHLGMVPDTGELEREEHQLHERGGIPGRA